MTDNDLFNPPAALTAPPPTEPPAAVSTSAPPPPPPSSTYKPLSLVSPFAGAKLTSGFGPRTPPMAGASSDHMGVDLAGVPEGTGVGAMADGVVQSAGPERGYGNTVRIRHADGSTALYGHLDSTAVKPGDVVKVGQTIGALGTTGTVTAPSLHVGLYSPTGQPVDPTSAFPAGSLSGAPANLTADEQADWQKLQSMTAPRPDPKNPDTGPGQGDFTYGSEHIPLSKAASATMRKIGADPARGIDLNADEGSSKFPYYAPPGGPIPGTPGAHWVDVNGDEHVVPGDFAQHASQDLTALGQGAVMDTLHSANKLFAGGISNLTRNPTAEPTLSQTEGLPQSPSLTEQAIEQGFQQQAHDYHVSHLGNKEAQGFRFAGQMIPATLAAAAVPEIEGAGWVGTALTNAARGTAAAATGVGPNSQPVAQQLGTGAIAGAILPPALGLAGKLGLGLTGVANASVSPEVRDLASKAINAYGIPLRGTQIAGVEAPTWAARDAKLMGTSGTKYAANDAAQQEAVTKAVVSAVGGKGDALTRPVMAQARTDLGQQFQNFGASHSVPDATALTGDLDKVMGEADLALPNVSPLDKQVNNIKALIAKNNNSLPGDVYLNLTKTGSPLDRAMESSDTDIGHYAGKIHDVLSDHLAQNATPEELANFADTRLKYKNLMTVNGLAAKAGVTGQITPSQLPAIVNRSFGDRAFSDGGPLGDLADIIQTFKPGATSASGKLASAVKGNLLPSALGLGATGEGVNAAVNALTGLGVGPAYLHDPMLAVGMGVGAGVTKGLGLLRGRIQGASGGAGAGSTLAGAQSPRNALGVLAEKAKPVVVPLSALAGVRLTPSPVGTNAQ